jgi:gliding motility-associated-like protein
MRFKLMIVFLFLASTLNAQNSGNIWYFGSFAGLDFNTPVPTILTNSVLSTNEGCASIADPITGTLLFYTDGISVWDKTHTQMPTSVTTPLLGNSSSSQSAVIVPKPGSSTIYYIITTPAFGVDPMCYSIVDLTLNFGNGDLTTTNVALMGESTEKIGVIGNCSGTEYWIVGHKKFSDSFYTFKLTNLGFSPPIKTAIGLVHIAGGNSEIGYMKFNSAGTKLALAMFTPMNQIEVFDFDNVTGAITNPFNDVFSFSATGFGGMYGISFSPDNSKLYCTGTGDVLFGGTDSSRLFQYDMTSNVPATILASRLQIVASEKTFGALQNAPNGKMYFPNTSTTDLNVINNPNNLGLACGYVASGQSSGFANLTYGLPGIVENFLTNNAGFPVKMKYNSCLGLDSITLPGGYDPTLSTFSWNFGEPSSGAANFSTLTFPTHNYANNGSYTVTVIVTGGCSLIDTFTTVVTIGTLNVTASNDTTICTNNTAQLNASSNSTAIGITYSWLPISTLSCITCINPTASPIVTTTYTVTAVTGNCIGTETVKITVDPGPNISILNNDTIYCKPGIPILLTTSGSNTYSWAPNTNLSCTTCPFPVASPNNSINYTVTATSANGCVDKDTLQIKIVPLQANLITLADSSCVGQFINYATPVFGAGATWVLNMGNGTLFNNQGNSIYAYPNPGIYNVQLIAQDTLGCNDTLRKTMYIDGENFGSFTLSDSNVCVGDMVAITDSISAFTKTWTYNFETDFSINNIHNPNYTYFTPGIYPITLISKNPFCVDFVFTRTIIVTPYPAVNLGPDLAYCPGLTAPFFINNLIATAGSHIWNDGSTDTKLSISEPGNYYVTVTQNGCSTSDSILVNRDCYLNIPNAFSPDGDGLNNYFLPTIDLSAGLTAFSMRIFNRWGNEVFYTTRIDSRGWDGKLGGQPQPIGTYVYQISAVLKNGERKNYTGNFTLIR